MERPTIYVFYIATIPSPSGEASTSFGVSIVHENYSSKGIMSTYGHKNHSYNTRCKNSLSVERGCWLGINPRL